MYKYFGFGLLIESQIEFPELLPWNFDEPELTIVLGAVPDSLQEPYHSVRLSSIVSKSEYLLSIYNISKYYAGFGEKIIVEPFAGSDEKSVRLFLLGSVMAAIIYQRGWIPLHASAVIDKGELVIFAGNSGVGKSTLAASLVDKGYQIFTDDICIFKQQGDSKKSIVGFASYPMMKLWEDAITGLNSKSFGKEEKVRYFLQKYCHYFYDDFQVTDYPIKGIFILQTSRATKEVVIDRLTPMSSFKELEKTAYRRYLIAISGSNANHFNLISDICGIVPVYKVSRPENEPVIGELADKVIALF